MPPTSTFSQAQTEEESAGGDWQGGPLVQWVGHHSASTSLYPYQGPLGSHVAVGTMAHRALLCPLTHVKTNSAYSWRLGPEHHHARLKGQHQGHPPRVMEGALPTGHAEELSGRTTGKPSSKPNMLLGQDVTGSVKICKQGDLVTTARQRLGQLEPTVTLGPQRGCDSPMARQAPAVRLNGE